jgi:predicted transposase YbfD/YdcC
VLGVVEPTVATDRKATTERRFHLSFASLDAIAFAATMRVRWRIGNYLRWVLDVGFDGDRARLRRRPFVRSRPPCYT